MSYAIVIKRWGGSTLPDEIMDAWLRDEEVLAEHEAAIKENLLRPIVGAACNGDPEAAKWLEERGLVLVRLLPQPEN